ncbi:unnamed protein product [Phytophthora fragariaefolia]|uniref:Unnamed protein product n=1 Tax=Phytophthora fragariaefolia TaxID=1490495 RepID=A0A9W6XQ38_9STRA|nr:unnamed protein product [Phytophthora fragariaefolia]
METWCRTHVTDHSGWNHRQHILNELTKRYQDAGDVDGVAKNPMLAEYAFVSDIMAPYPSHEALWCHRRYVMQRLLQQAKNGSDSTDHVPVDGLLSRVSSTFSDSQAEVVETAPLTASWNETFTTLSSDVVGWSSILRAILQEMETAWRCGNQFSRRYAAWCLARLRTFLRGRRAQDQALAHELSSLATNLQKHLVQEDSVLIDLWLRM